MRLKNIPGAREAVEASAFTINNPEDYKGHWSDLHVGKLHIEIGMGKGQFITALAERNPDIFYIGIERYQSVMLRAVQKMDELQLPNLRFICMDAADIENYFAPGEVDRIYLNFSDPWPKDRHAKRRLTSDRFMPRYKNILNPEGQLEFKTDNKGLFEYSLESIPASGWTITAKTFDLHKDASMNEGNIMTEYEEKFSSKGNPIYKLIAKP